LLDSTTRGIDHSRDGKIRIIRYHGRAVSFTVVGIQRDTPGTYTVTALPGSVPFIKIARATDLPDARITGTVTGRATSTARVLRYSVLSRPGQSVSLYDVAEGGSAKGIGSVRGGSGQIHFTTAPGRRPHQIVAQFSLQGLPAERIVVATFRPPPPTLPRPQALRVTRHKSTLTISWRPVLDATAYEVAITSPSGLQQIVRTGRTSVVIRRLPAAIAGLVTVRAVDATRHSPVASARFRSIAAATRAIKPLGHCTVGRRKIRCRR
jgi:hypothetical protein